MSADKPTPAPLTLTTDAIKVLGYLRTIADPDGITPWVPMEEHRDVANQLGISRNSVHRSLKALVDAGLLVRAKRCEHCRAMRKRLVVPEA